MEADESEATDSALSALRRVTLELIHASAGHVDEFAVGWAAEDAGWAAPAYKRRAVTRLWEQLQESVTAEIGSCLRRELDDWSHNFDEPLIVTARPNEFDPDYEIDNPYGWVPLARAHQREARWDFAPQREAGEWIGWWEPEDAQEVGEGAFSVSGALTAFIVVRDGNLEFAHVVKRRRRSGVATKLVTFAMEHHRLTRSDSFVTADGSALLAALRRDGLIAEQP